MKNNIKILRENRNLTQKDCADIFGVTLRAWQTYEQGVSDPKYETLCKIADYFDVTVDYLLGRECNPKRLNQRDEELEAAFIDVYTVPSRKTSGRTYSTVLRIRCCRCTLVQPQCISIQYIDAAASGRAG